MKEDNLYWIMHWIKNKNHTVMWSFKFKSAFLTKKSNIKKVFGYKKSWENNKETLERFIIMKEEFSSKNDHQLIC